MLSVIMKLDFHPQGKFYFENREIITNIRIQVNAKDRKSARNESIACLEWFAKDLRILDESSPVKEEVTGLFARAVKYLDNFLVLGNTMAIGASGVTSTHGIVGTYTDSVGEHRFLTTGKISIEITSSY